MMEENRELSTLQDLKSFLVYARHLGLKNSISTKLKKRHYQNFLVEVKYMYP